LESIKEIGKVKLKDINCDDKFLEIFTVDISKGTKYDKIIEIILDSKNDDISFNNVNFREYDDELKLKYLYKGGAARGTNITPTAKITECRKTFVNKTIMGYKEALKSFDRNEENNYEKILIKNVIKCLEKEKEQIIKAVEEIFNSIPKKERYVVLTVVIKEDEKNIYIGDFEVFKLRMRNIPVEKFYYSQTNKKNVKGLDSQCCICNNIKSEVYGLASPFAFYTIDKPGYISGGFNYEKAWRNYPVCKECAVELELGKNYLDENLKLSFCGRRFYLIPKLIFNKNLSKLLAQYRGTFKNSDEDKKAKKLITPEERLFKKLGKEDNTVTFDLMFIEENNAALNILLNIEDVYPSTFSKLYNQWEKIKEMKFFKGIEYLANFNYLNYLFNSKENNRYFLEITDRIIGKGKIEYNFFIKFVNKLLIEAFKKEEKGEHEKGKDSYYLATLRAYTFIYYLYKVDKFRNRGKEGVGDMDKEIWKLEDFSCKKEVFEDYFNINSAFFNTDSKKAVFMIGYLTKNILDYQYVNEDGRKPFLNNLNGLNLNKRDIIRLMPKIQGKLVEYKAEYYNEEFTVANEFLIKSEGLRDLANLDIPLYFSLGMNMNSKFDLNKKEQENRDSISGEVK
jgi:CRISPR-associated protein Csh1